MGNPEGILTVFIKNIPTIIGKITIAPKALVHIEP